MIAASAECWFAALVVLTPERSKLFERVQPNEGIQVNRHLAHEPDLYLRAAMGVVRYTLNFLLRGDWECLNEFGHEIVIAATADPVNVVRWALTTQFPSPVVPYIFVLGSEY